MPDLGRETLLRLDFVDIAAWRAVGEEINYHLDGESAEANNVRLDVPNALYAFVNAETVQYIGKTTQSLRKRLVGYRNPGRSQATNLRCNANIKKALIAGFEIRILVFAPISHLKYDEFEINLAAGLEDSLIKEFDPPWNGREKGVPISEDSEREKADDEAAALAAPAGEAAALASGSMRAAPLATFAITLGQAYYYQGLINPGVDASKYLGSDGEPIQILFSDGSEPVVSQINRTANVSGAVRVVGRNRNIADWFQKHFRIGEVVEARILDRNHILLVASKA